MRLLDRYLLRELWVPLAYCLTGFLLFWVLFDLLDDLDRFRDLHLGVAGAARYYWLRLPELLATVGPVALLLACLYSLANHARHQEITAIRAAGVGLWRVALPYLASGAALGAGLFLINEFLAPEASLRAEEMLAASSGRAGAEGRGRWRRNLTFLNEADRRLWNIGLYDRQTGRMWAVMFDWIDPEGARRRVAAAEGVYTNGVWVFHDVKELFYEPGPPPQWVRSETNRLAMPELTETPESIESEIMFADSASLREAVGARMSLRQILNYRRFHPRLKPQAYARLMTQFHGRIAEPWTCVIVALAAIPFAVGGGRRNVFVGVAAAVFLVFGYFVLTRLSMGLGAGGYLPPWLAAWAPNAIFGGGAAVLIHRAQ